MYNRSLKKIFWRKKVVKIKIKILSLGQGVVLSRVLRLSLSTGDLSAFDGLFPSGLFYFYFLYYSNENFNHIR